MSECPCCSGSAFDACCKPILADVSSAVTAEQVMRARYTAYVRSDIDFLCESLDAEGREAFDADGARQWAESAEWQGLEVLATDGGGADDSEGAVEFVASYLIEEREQHHHEVARFTREEGVWRFVEGRVVGVDPYVREKPKVGRNDPCPCGSGKKFKKCCG
jgi:SEC-C motif-containing protein